MPGKNSPRWRWLEDGAIPLVATAMRVAWISPVLHVLLNNPIMHPIGLKVPTWWLATLLLAPQGLERAKVPGRRALALYVALGSAAILLTWAIAFGFGGYMPLEWLRAHLTAMTDWSLGIPNELVLAGAAVLIWQRGLTGRDMRYDDLWRGFVWGAIALGMLMLLSTDALATIAGVDIVISIVTFVLAGLIGLALLALTGTLATENLRSRTRLGVSRSWLAVAGSTAFAVLLLGWAAGLILAPKTVTNLLKYLAPAWNLLITLLLGLATLIAYAVLWLIRPVLQSAYDRLIPILQRNDLGELRRYLMEDLQIGTREPASSNALWQFAWRPLLITALAALALWLIIRAWRGRTQRPEGGIVETRESILTPGLIRTQIAQLLRRAKQPAPFLPLDPEPSRRSAVRALYRSLLLWARDSQAPRHRGTTPGGYEEELAARWAEHAPALHTVTRGYELARYGRDDPTAEDVDHVRSALGEILPPTYDKGGAGIVRPRRPVT